MEVLFPLGLLRLSQVVFCSAGQKAVWLPLAVHILDPNQRFFFFRLYNYSNSTGPNDHRWWPLPSSGLPNHRQPPPPPSPSTMYNRGRERLCNKMFLCFMTNFIQSVFICSFSPSFFYIYKHQKNVWLPLLQSVLMKREKYVWVNEWCVYHCVVNMSVWRARHQIQLVSISIETMLTFWP